MSIGGRTGLTDAQQADTMRVEPVSGSTTWQPPAPPVLPAERVELLDALRGFALLGIFVINLRAFSEWTNISAAEQAALPTASLDPALHFLATLLAEGKFYSLFSLLFGIGFAVQMLRAADKGVDFAPRFRRRLWVLLGIGMVHLCLIWMGDILVLYALLGFLLVPLRRFGDRPLLLAAVALILAPIAVHSVIVLSGGALNPATPLRTIAVSVDADFGFDTADYPWVLGRLGWIEFFQVNLGGPFWRFAGLLETSRAPKVLAMFLVGFVAARRLDFRDLAAHRGLLRRVLAGGLALGVTVNAGWAWITTVQSPPFVSWPGVLETVAYAFGVAPLALAWAAAFALLWQRPGWQRRLARLAPAGRMALTNYLLQSVIGVGLFYGIGLGWVGRVGPALIVPLVVVIFAVQIQLSALWLRHFRYGPAEWVWRSLTYGQRQPLRTHRHDVVIGIVH
jgi:uncharacterized protein